MLKGRERVVWLPAVSDKNEKIPDSILSSHIQDFLADQDNETVLRVQLTILVFFTKDTIPLSSSELN